MSKATRKNKRKQQELIEQLGKIIDSSFDEVYVFSQDTLKFVQANRGAIKNIGYTMEELKSMTPLDLKMTFTKEQFLEMLYPLIIGQKDMIIFETTHTRKNGSSYPVEVRLQTSVVDSKKYFFAVIMDIEERKHTEWIIREQGNYLKAIVDTTPECVILLGDDTVILDINPTGVLLLQANHKDDVIEKEFINYVSPEFKEQFIRMHKRTLQHRKSDSLEFEIILNNVISHVEMRIAPLSDANNDILASLAVIRDITARKQAELEIQKLAYCDPLTGLYNRREFDNRLKNLTANHRRNKEPFALMVIDLDDFGAINNTLGHQTGDDLLVQLGGRLKNKFKRETDFIARYGGDEFVILISGIQNLNDSASDIIQKCKSIAQSLVEELDKPYYLNKQTMAVTASIGIAVCLSSQNITPDELLRRADEAMYNAKRAGKNDFNIHPVM